MPANNPYCCPTCELSFKGTTICPKCKKEMILMGKKFRSPRKGAKNQWNKIRLLIANGIKFYGCYGNCCVEKMPKTFAEAKQYIKRKLVSKISY